MQLFYDPDILEGTHQLRDGEARHAFRVLRKRAGDTLDLVDGKGGWYRGEIESIDKRACTLSVRRTRRETPPNYQVTLLVAPTKNIDRFEWLLEKCTEIGIYAIQPFISEHSERKNIRVDRLERVIESAMKQSLRAWKPTLFDCMSYDRAIASVSAAQPKFLAYLGSDRTPMLHQVFTRWEVRGSSRWPGRRL